MLVVKKETLTFKNNELREDYFKGMRCRWFTTDGQMQEAIFSTKDLIKYEWLETNNEYFRSGLSIVS